MTEYRYKAFISYSHADESAGDWLHRALETYSVPKNLVGKKTDSGSIPRRLTPIFRDKDDLPAAGNLNDTIIDALKNSQYLVVLASPNAVKSKWVKEEIKQFKAFHGPDRVLAIIVEGEPFASDNPKIDDALECFPEPLRFNQEPGGAKIPAEPLAADARPSAGGHTASSLKNSKKAATTKLVAGILGVPLDDLVQREAHRDARKMQIVGGVAVAIIAVLSASTLFAFHQRNVAEEQRAIAEEQRNIAEEKTAEAEGLLDFMITDVREEVEQEVGRLDALETLADRALEYYADQDLEALDADALGRRARALHFSGRTDQRRNNLDNAIDAYKDAAASTKAQLALDPNNPKRIFEHAQSLFYVGDLQRNRGQLEDAKSAHLQYLEQANRLVGIDPNNADWILEVAYATNNLGIVEMEKSSFVAALTFFDQSVEARKGLLENDPGNPRRALPYAAALAWKALAEIELGDFATAISTIDNQLSVYEPFTNPNETNFRTLSAVLTAHRRKSEAFLYLGLMEKAQETLDRADDIVLTLLVRDPSNALWKINAARFSLRQSALFRLRGDSDRELQECEEALRYTQEVLNVDASGRRASDAYLQALTCKVKTGRSNESERVLLAGLLVDLEQPEPTFVSEAVAAAAIALANTIETDNQQARADELREKTIAALRSDKKPLAVARQLLLLELLLDRKQIEKAQVIVEEFENQKMMHPKSIALRKRFAELTDGRPQD